jgi:hypothetical protein
MEQNEKHHLTDITVRDVTVPVSISINGTFSTTLSGEEYEASGLNALRKMIDDAIITSRHEVPFITTSGSRGIMRGWHAGQSKFLVTWANGEKGTLDEHKRVWRSGEVSDEHLAEMRGTREQIEAAKARLDELDTATTRAGDLFAEVFGEDVTDPRRGREAAV